MKKLPLGIQEFSKLRTQDLLYVDKTEYIFKLINEGSYYFLSRPRRFGKSLLVNTLKEVFSGNKHYFEGLWIENKIDWQKYAVILIDFSNVSYKDQSLNEGLKNYLKLQALNFGIALKTDNVKEIFSTIITELYQKTQQQIVLLIDEYDKPIIDFVELPEKAEENRDTLKNLYSIIKPSDKYLKFVLLTGVSKFSKVGIFSDLNNITDITMHPKFVNLVGYTQAELEFYFKENIENLCAELKLSREELLLKIKNRYNGYSWNIKDRAYNSYSVLSFFDSGKFDNFWFSTGTPTFLTKLLRKGFHYEIKNITAGYNSFDTSDFKNLAYVPVLFQTGYLTLKEDLGYDMFSLDFPNSEVKDSFHQFLLAEYAFLQPADMQPLSFSIFNALKINDFETIKVIFNSLFGSIPREFFTANKERFYHAIMYLTFKLLGYFTQIEIKTGIGILDCVVIMEKGIFIFEFKLNQSAKVALEQIKEKKYFEPYLSDNKNIYLIGVNMNSRKKAIDEFQIEILEK